MLNTQIIIFEVGGPPNFSEVEVGGPPTPQLYLRTNIHHNCKLFLILVKSF
jgi:hypothetical protein